MAQVPAWYVYTFIADRPLRAVKAKIRSLTNRTSQQDLSVVLINLNRAMHGWARYFRHEWSVRLRRTFSVTVLLDATRDVLTDLLGEGRLSLEARATGHGAIDGDLVLSSGSSVELARVDAIDTTVVDVLDVGYPEDAEGGLWLTAASYRTEVSMLISVSAAIAAAKLTDAHVIDEPGMLGKRVSTPAEAIERLRRVDLTGASTVEEGALLIVTSLRQD
jgi:hypothetical protein